MRLTVHKSAFRAGWWAALGAGMLAAGQARAQDNRVFYLPRAAGATPASVWIEAQAKHVAAVGYFLESAAIARKINAEAVAIELENSLRYVDVYFEGREKNRKWREIERGGTHLEKLSREEKVREELMTKHFEDLLKRDPTEALNWLLTQLSGPTMAVQYSMGRESLRPFDAPLEPTALAQIYVTDGGKGNSRLVFALSNQGALKTPWPYALQAAAFDSARKEYEAARQAVLKELQENGRAGEESGNRLVKSVNQLLVGLETVYPLEDRKKDSAVFLTYNSARRYLQSLVSQVNRTLTTQDNSVFDGSLDFTGKTVLDLIQYMYQKGLMFDKHREGGERIYRNLLMNMRSVYLTLGSERAAPGKN